MTMRAAFVLLVSAYGAVAASPESGLVSVQERAPGIALDMRYYGTENFVGEKIDGYAAPKCLLLGDAADALARVETSLRKQGLRLRVFDCYRPQRAVAHFMRWARDLSDQRTKATYYPNLDKSTLVPGYIAEQSGHSRGATVDLTLMRCTDSGCEPLDMGTPFDFFDPLANTDSPAITARQRSNRERLREAMQREGFENYPMEWWHYTLPLDPPAIQAFDRVVE